LPGIYFKGLWCNRQGFLLFLSKGLPDC